MNTITDKLAQALRGFMDQAVVENCDPDEINPQVVENARATLAEYDAQRNSSAAPAGAHTPEPWCMTGDGDYTTIRDEANHQEVAAVEWDGEVGGLANTNARRIVACVNACAGFTTEALESLQPQQLFFLWDEWENQ